MPHETTLRLTIGTIVAAIVVMAGSLVWAGNITAETRQSRVERREVIQELRELRKEVQSMQVQSAKMFAELSARGCACKEER